MRKIIFYMITLMSINSFAQSTVKYMDAKTKAPVSETYSYIFKMKIPFSIVRLQ